MVESTKRKEKLKQGGKREMKTEYEQRWNELAQEVLLEMRSWREEHPTATLQEIEEEVDSRMARMRAGLVEGTAMTSTAVEVGSRATVTSQHTVRHVEACCKREASRCAS